MYAELVKNERIIKVGLSTKEPSDSNGCVYVFDKVTDFLKFSRCTDNWYSKVGSNNDKEIMYAFYNSEDDDIVKMFYDLYCQDGYSEPEKYNKEEQKEGVIENYTSKLVIRRSSEEIKIARRTGKERELDKDILFIDNQTRDNFFEEVKKSVSYKKYGRYSLYKRLDKKLYEKWESRF